MGANLTTIQEILKETYKDPIIETLNNKVALTSILDTDAESFQIAGESVTIPLHIGRNEGIGARPEAGTTSASDLPVAGAQSYSNLQYNTKNLYGSASFSGKSMSVSRSNEGAFARIMESEIDGLTRDLVRDVNRQYNGTATGKLGTIVGHAGDTSKVGSGTLGNTVIEVDNIQFIRVGMVLDLVDLSATAAFAGAGTGVTITNVVRILGSDNKQYSQVTLDTDVSGLSITNDADFLVRTATYTNEIWGLQDIVSASNPTGMPSGYAAIDKFVGGFDRTTSTVFNSQVIDHANADFDEFLFQQAIDLSDREADGMISIFITTYDIYRQYAKTMLPDRRYDTSGEMFQKLDAAYGALSYDGKPVIKERDCKPNTCFALATDRLMNINLEEWDFVAEDGNILTKIPNKDGYSLTMRAYKQFATDDAADHVLISNIGPAANI